MGLGWGYDDGPYKLDARGGHTPSRADDGVVVPTTEAIEDK